MTSTSLPVSEVPQTRPTAAKTPRPLSLRVRLALLVALSIALVVGIEAYLEGRVFERAAEYDLHETARLTALAVADDYELRSEPVDAAALSQDLHEFALAAPSLRTLSIVDVRADGASVVASTSSEERPEAIGMAEQAVREGRTVSGAGPFGTETVAVPVVKPGGRHAAAVATVSLAALEQFRTKGRRVTLWFTPAAILALTLVVDALARRLIHRPIARIRATMARAGAGDFTARADIVRDDEIGSVALGLNEMLEHLQNFNVALQERVDEATAVLRVRNEELVDSYERGLLLREALARAEQLAAVGQMAASVAHQVGTPLNLISGYVQMMQQESAADPKNLRRLQIVQEQIAKVAAVVRTLLDHSRRPDVARPTDVGQLLSRVADVARPKLDAARIALSLDVADDLPPLTADAEELELAILNLVTNSLDAMPDGGSLHLEAGRVRDRVRIAVRDTGRGIPPDLLPRIFDPWVTTKAAGRGTGLGLSITRDAITRHGGTIAAESVPGEGTTFIIELPLGPAAETPDAAHPDR
jgi:signal transduction histidine kinase